MQNPAFATLLRTFGYDLYTIGARICSYQIGQYAPLLHMAIIVILDGVQYLVDVALGVDGLTAPLPIFDGKLIDRPIKGVFPEEHRVTLSVIPGTARRDHKAWAMQRRANPEKEWISLYIFEKDMEFVQGDYEM